MSAGVALVFGGSRGIGAAIALRLAKDGFDVALSYVSQPDQAGDIVSAIENVGRHAVAIKADSATRARSALLSPRLFSSSERSMSQWSMRAYFVSHRSRHLRLKKQRSRAWSHT